LSDNQTVVLRFSCGHTISKPIVLRDGIVIQSQGSEIVVGEIEIDSICFGCWEAKALMFLRHAPYQKRFD
jgi:hypothetical protein